MTTSITPLNNSYVHYDRSKELQDLLTDLLNEKLTNREFLLSCSAEEVFRKVALGCKGSYSLLTVGERFPNNLELQNDLWKLGLSRISLKEWFQPVEHPLYKYNPAIAELTEQPNSLQPVLEKFWNELTPEVLLYGPNPYQHEMHGFVPRFFEAARLYNEDVTVAIWDKIKHKIMQTTLVTSTNWWQKSLHSLLCNESELPKLTKRVWDTFVDKLDEPLLSRNSGIFDACYDLQNKRPEYLLALWDRVPIGTVIRSNSDYAFFRRNKLLEPLLIKLCNADSTIVDVHWNDIKEEVTEETAKAILPHIHHRRIFHELIAKFWEEIPLNELLAKNPTSLLWKMSQFSQTTAENVWQKHKKDITEDDLHYTDQEDIIIKSGLEEIVAQFPKIASGTKFTSYKTLLENMGTLGDKVLKCIISRNKLFDELDRLNEADKVSLDDLKRAETIAINAQHTGYYNAFYDLAQLLDEKKLFQEQAAVYYSKVPKESWHYEETLSQLPYRYIQLAEEAVGEKREEYIEKAIDAATRLPKQDLAPVMECALVEFLALSPSEKDTGSNFMPMHILEAITPHTDPALLMAEFRRIKNMRSLKAEIAALEAKQ